KVYRLKGYEIPEVGGTAKGLQIINLLQIEKDEWTNTVISVNECTEDHYLFFTTRRGLAKGVNLRHFKHIRRRGRIAISWNEDEGVIAVRNTGGDKDIGIATKHGYFVRFDENVVRTMGRNAAGVKGISLRENDEVVSMQIIEPDTYLLHITNKGIGKRTK